MPKDKVSSHTVQHPFVRWKILKTLFDHSPPTISLLRHQHIDKDHTPYVDLPVITADGSSVAEGAPQPS